MTKNADPMVTLCVTWRRRLLSILNHFGASMFGLFRNKYCVASDVARDADMRERRRKGLIVSEGRTG